MKNTIINSSCALLVLIFTLFSCNVLETEEQYPGVAIYKTKGDYFNLVTVGMKGDKISRMEGFWNARYNSIIKMEVVNNDTIYTGRHRLPQGFILDSEAGVGDIYLNLTFKEYLNREIINSEKGLPIPADTLRKYILDRDPYIEFYRNNTNVKRFYLSDSLQIKEVLQNGEIDKYFERIK